MAVFRVMRVVAVIQMVTN